MKSPQSLKLPSKLKFPLVIRRVSGDSMLPTLKPGQLVLVRQFAVKPETGQIVVVSHQGLDKIKRITELRNRQVYFEGDNKSSSTDSRDWGWISEELITGVLIAH